MSSLFSKRKEDEEDYEDEKDFDQLISDFSDNNNNNQSDSAEEETTPRSSRRTTTSSRSRGKKSVGGTSGEPYFDVSLPTLFEANMEFKTLFDYLEKGIIDLDPEFQREVVWTEAAQKKLLNSIESNICLPPLIFNIKTTNGLNYLTANDLAGDGDNELEDGTYICCDGKQRITSIHKFMKNEIAIVDDNKISWYYNRKSSDTATIKSFSNKRRNEFDNRTIGIACYNSLNRDQESLLFSRIQEGKALSYDERLRATAGGQMASFIEKVVDIYFIEDIDDRGLCYNSRLINLSRAKEFTSAFRTILNIIDGPTHWSQLNLTKLIVERPGVTPEEEKLVFRYMDRFVNLTLIGQQSSNTKGNSSSRKKPHKVWIEPKAVAPVELPWLPILIQKYKHFNDGDLLEVIGMFRKELCGQFPNNVSLNPTVENWIKKWISKTINVDSLTHKFQFNNSSSKSSSLSQKQKSPEPFSIPRRISNANASTSTFKPPSLAATSTAIKRSSSSQQISSTSSSSSSKRLKSTTTTTSTGGSVGGSNSGRAPILSSDSEDSDSNTPLGKRIDEQKNSPRSTAVGSNAIKLSGSPLVGGSSRLPGTGSSGGSSNNSPRFPPAPVPAPAHPLSNLSSNTNNNNGGRIQQITNTTTNSTIPNRFSPTMNQVSSPIPTAQSQQTQQGRAIASLPSFIRKGGSFGSGINNGGGIGLGLGLGSMEVDRKPIISNPTSTTNSTTTTTNSNNYYPQASSTSSSTSFYNNDNNNDFNWMSSQKYSQLQQLQASQLKERELNLARELYVSTQSNLIDSSSLSTPTSTSTSNLNSNPSSASIAQSQQGQNQKLNPYELNRYKEPVSGSNSNSPSQAWPEPTTTTSTSTNQQRPNSSNGRNTGSVGELDPVYLARVNSSDGSGTGLVGGLVGGGSGGGNVVGGGNGNSSLRNFFPDFLAVRTGTGNGSGSGSGSPVIGGSGIPSPTITQNGSNSLPPPGITVTNPAKTAAELLMSQSLL